MIHPIKQFIDRKQILLDYGQVENDVLEDDHGEYILVEPNLMDEGEPEDGAMKKIYLQ